MVVCATGGETCKSCELTGECLALEDAKALIAGLMNHNQPMPRGGKRDGAGRKPNIPGDPKTERFTVRCTKAQKKLLQIAWGDILSQTESHNKPQP